MPSKRKRSGKGEKRRRTSKRKTAGKGYRKYSHRKLRGKGKITDAIKKIGSALGRKIKSSLSSDRAKKIGRELVKIGAQAAMDIAHGAAARNTLKSSRNKAQRFILQDLLSSVN